MMLLICTHSILECFTLFYSFASTKRATDSVFWIEWISLCHAKFTSRLRRADEILSLMNTIKKVSMVR